MEYKMRKFKNYVKIVQQIKVPMSLGNLQKHWNENKCKTEKSWYEMSVSRGAYLKEYMKVQQKTFHKD